MSSENKNKEHRNFIKRQNRSFALYLLIQCWILKLDGVKVSHQVIKDFSGLARLDSSRIEWLIEDFKPFFEFAKEAEEKEGSIIFSRIPIEEKNEDTLRGWIQIPNDYHEAQVSIYLALLSQGLIQPTINKDQTKFPIVHPPVDFAKFLAEIDF